MRELNKNQERQSHGGYIEIGKSDGPEETFFTKGKGTHKERLTSFELALRDAGIASQNLVRVSSIFPPQCKVIPRKEGLKLPARRRSGFFGDRGELNA